MAVGFGTFLELLCSLKLYLLAFVMKPAEKVVLILPFLQSFHSSRGHCFRQLSKCRQACGLWNGNTCPREDHQLVVLQGFQEMVWQINS